MFNLFLRTKKINSGSVIIIRVWSTMTRVSGFIKQHEANKNNPETLPENNVWSLFQSRDKTLWGSTTGPESAVFKIKQKSYVQHALESSSSFAGAFYESRDKKLWVSSYGKGVFKLDLQTGEKKFFEPKKITHTNIYQGKDKFLLNENTVFHRVDKIVEDNLGKLWMIKAFFPGLLHFNPDNSEVTAYSYHPNDEGSLGEGMVSDILKDRQGRIWVVTTKGDLNLYENGRFIKYKYTSLTSEELGLGYNCQLIQSRNGKYLAL